MNNVASHQRLIDALLQSTHPHAHELADELSNAGPDYFEPSPPQPTWLDQCAWVVAAGASANPNFNGPPLSQFAKEAYNVAAAMWAEKQRREAAAGGAS